MADWVVIIRTFGEPEHPDNVHSLRVHSHEAAKQIMYDLEKVSGMWVWIFKDSRPT